MGVSSATILAPVKRAQHSLPLAPVITPALGIAGAFLILTGLVYGLIGIKHRSLHVFLTCGYLASLSVTVLIIYLATPPISDAVQGAFFVAACVAGLSVGGVSLIFKEILEGLGCLLGGFCFAMWLTTLRAGGLIQVQGGTAAVIIGLSVAFYGLSFVRRIRSHALIACASFAGATATILGIDCYSRSGLKEFWMYIWGLNEKFFPQGTNHYPLTKGIRVETGCIPVLFVFGLISQLRIWKSLKVRREQKATERLRQDEDREKYEVDVGRQVNETFAEDLVMWEATYGEKTPQVSQLSYGLDDPHRSSAHNRSTSKTSSPTKHSTPQKRNFDGQKMNVENIDEISVLPNSQPIVSVRESSDEILHQAQSTDIESTTHSRKRSTSLQQEYPSLRPRQGPPPPVIPPTLAFDPESFNGSEAACYQVGEDETGDDESVDDDDAGDRGQSNNTVLHSPRDSHQSPIQPRECPKDASSLGRALVYKDHSSPSQVVTETQAIDGHTAELYGNDDKVFDFERVARGDETETNSIQNSKAAEDEIGDTYQKPGVHDASPTSPRVLELENLPWPLTETAALDRTNEWTKTLDDADQPNSESGEQETGSVSEDDRCSANDASEYERMKHTESLWMGFEGTHMSNTSGSLTKQVKDIEHKPKGAQSTGRKLNSSRSRVKKQDKRTSYAAQPTIETTTKAPILPSPVKSKRAHHSSLPALTTTGQTLAEQRDVLVAKQRRESTGHPPSTRTSSSYYPSEDTDNMTLSERRASLQQYHGRKPSSGQASTASSTGPRTPSTIYTPATIFTTSTSTSPALPSLPTCPPFAMTALPLRNPYPQPQTHMRGLSGSSQTPSSPVPEHRGREKHRDSQANKVKRDVEMRRRQKAVDDMMRSGKLELAHQEALRKMQRVANKSLG